MFDLKGKKLLVFGDSIINGSGNNNFGVGEYLERDYGVKLYKYCIGGARVGFVEGKSWVVEQVRKIIRRSARYNSLRRLYERLPRRRAARRNVVRLR